MLSTTQPVRQLRSTGRFGPAQLLALVLALMISATLVVAMLVHGPVLWGLVVGQGLIAGIGGWLLQRKAQQAQRLGQLEAEQSQALLERLSIATQAAGIYCWELDWNTYAITWDESRLPAAEAAAASRRHFGVELGSDLFKWVHPEDQHSGGKAITDSLARGEDHASFRYRLVLPDGSIRHVQAFARTYSDDAGKPQRSLGVSWDVTQEVEAAERAARDASKERQLLERLSLATQAAGLQSWEYDFKQMKITWVDLGAEQEDLNPEAVHAAGEAMFDQLLPEDRQAGMAMTDAATARGDPMLSTRSRRRDADGSLRHIQMYQRFFYDAGGARLRALGANLDITESYQRQAELEALSIRFAIATRAAHAGVWEWQERNDELWWNDTMYSIYGCSADRFKPTFDTVVKMIHPDDIAIAHAAWNDAVRLSTQLHVTFRIIRPDGGIAHLDSLAALVTDSRTSERRLVGITLDISQRVAAEQRERQLQRQLREASHQSGMAEVATGVLHNVGNVLNSLGVASSTVQARLKTSQFDRVQRVADLLDEHRDALGAFFTSDPRGKRLPEYLSALGAQTAKDVVGLQQEIDAISGHVQYLCEIVQAQQSFARVGSAEEAVDVRELVDTALTLKGQELRGVDIEREIADMPEVVTDRYKLLQIVVNFIANACDAMSANGSVPRRIAIRAGVALGQLEISVQDSGVGIPAELLPRIWEFGFTTKTQGHGFGLHSSAVAAQQLGGTIAAISDGPGRGARFCVKIPLDTPSAGRLEAMG
ncbi:MAG TPA: PAS domain-containing protein [Steroidobacteraceae bacterium]